VATEPSGRLLSTSSEDTAAAGAALAARLAAGDVVIVSGEMGAGKTTLIRGACRALGVTGRVTSPTFTVGRRYPSPPARVAVSHLDLHRLGTLDGEDPGLLADYLTPDAIAFVEWGELGAGHLPAASRRVRIRHAGEDRREIELDAT
jgi:tRNA threonylcarbamoyladenosine biosynthesis protein TsaE